MAPLLAVLGGGQLGRMLGLAAIPLGARLRFLDPSPAAGAGAVGDLVVGDLDDPVALATLAQDADAVTFEWEGVPAEAVAWLAAAGHAVFPAEAALRASQDRLAEKELFRALGIPTAPFAPVDGPGDLDAAVAAIGLPAILKARRGGYDGKGQVRVESPGDLAAARRAAARRPSILEGVVAFDRELSVLACRGRDRETVYWPLVHNEHRGGILRVARAPVVDLAPATTARAMAAVTSLLDATGYCGTVCMELFEVGSELIANEFAPRVHNSGHWTIEGATASQFELHLRAGFGWPLTAADPRGWSATVNCIGRLPDPRAVLAIPGTHLHLYGKSPRAGRKVGHVTVTAPDAGARDDALARLRAVIEDDG